MSRTTPTTRAAASTTRWRRTAWGFCIYNDVALAVARARADGLRVLYVDLDVHHGDGVQAAFFRDPGALTLSIHESGRYLFPQTGFIEEMGEGSATAASVNLPLEPYTGDDAWLMAVRSLVPTLAAVFGPDVVVSQHGADSHAWDPLAHLRVTTTAMAEAARIVDAAAHRWAGGRWLATGGGGYDAYRVVPRAWALTWLAGAHREVPDETPAAWRSRWEAAAGAFGTPGMPSPSSTRRTPGCRPAAARRRPTSGRWRCWPGCGWPRCRGWSGRRRTAAGGGPSSARGSRSAPRVQPAGLGRTGARPVADGPTAGGR